MAPQKVHTAIDAMKAIGIPSQTAKPVLKRLLKTYDNNWELIEDESYRVLADAIFELQDSKRVEDENDASICPGTRTRPRQEECQSLPSSMHSDALPVESSSKRLKLDDTCSSQFHHVQEESQSDHPRTSTQPQQEENQPLLFSVFSDALPADSSSEGPSSNDSTSQFCHIQVKAEPGALQKCNTKKGNEPICDEPCVRERTAESVLSKTNGKEQKSTPISTQVSSREERLAFEQGSSVSLLKLKKPKVEPGVDIWGRHISSHNHSSAEVLPKSEPLEDDVPITVIHPPLKITGSKEGHTVLLRNGGSPSISNSSGKAESSVTLLAHYAEPQKGFEDENPETTSKKNAEHESLFQNALDSLNHRCQLNLKDSTDSNKALDKKEGAESYNHSRSIMHSFVAVGPSEFTHDAAKPLHDLNDITKGEESVRISVVNELSSERYPPSFFYIPQNILYQNAYVNFSLARIGDENCCADCFGNCLAASIPCACARETGGVYAYTFDGRIKKEFLDECISMNHDPQKNRLFFCKKDCPLEMTKNEIQPEACKGHLVRKFIKECWSKCGCSRQCGNRVVQGGITCNLQVFLTSEGKGWGLRTLEELPRGTFVCEYVGEILTNMELYDRTIQTTGKDRHTYPVLLDADWGSEGVLKDEALCLDATFYGNVARFINHRCYDANLVEIPVEVETPDHHYYHVAFFTTRDVQALEELTWDYGIDFDDHNHPIKAFRCCCGSQFCRDSKRSRRSKAKALNLR